MSEMKLSGGEVSVIKALGLSGTPMYGKMLIERLDMVASEFVDVLDTLIAEDYILSSKVNILKIEDVENAYFRVNPSCCRELRDALRPGRKEQDRPRRRRC